MKTHEADTESTAASNTPIVAAMVVRLDLEHWPELKAKAEELGGKIVFQRIAPPQVHLWILDREPEEMPPRRAVARGWDQ